MGVGFDAGGAGAEGSRRNYKTENHCWDHDTATIETTRDIVSARRKELAQVCAQPGPHQIGEEYWCDRCRRMKKETRYYPSGISSKSVQWEMVDHPSLSVSFAREVRAEATHRRHSMSSQ